MDIRLFFKPTIGKFVLMVILFLIIGLLFPIIPVFATVLCKTGVSCNPILVGVTLPQILDRYQYVDHFGYLPFLVELLLFYWMSCGFVYLFQNFKRKPV
jgi:hypothetical protein